MTAELEDQQEKAKDEKIEDLKIQSDDEKIQKIGENDDLAKNGEKKEPSDVTEKTKPEESKEPEEVAQEEEEPVTVAPRRRVPRFWERLFSRATKRHDTSAQDVEAGTELLAKEKNKIEVKPEEEKQEKNDIEVAVAEDVPNGNAKDDDAEEKNGKYAGLSCRRVAVGLLVIAILLTIVTLISVLTSASDRARGPMMEPIVVTDCGLLRGYMEDNMYIFNGVPYAMPPTGEYRWKPPRSASSLDDCWTETYEAINKTAFCYQSMIPGIDMEMSEDCLYLDIITPSLSPPKPRPVVVYFPGDHPMEGFNAADLSWRPTTTLADEKDLTFVTVKYRLGAFGFLSLDLLTNNVRPPTSGNYGIMDMIAALKWVQKNILVFGGDPGKVTVLAHGGGATAALALLSSKKSEDLFHGMWLTAPAARFNNDSLSDINEMNNVFLKKLDCDSIECLHNKTSEEILRATPSSWNSNWASELPSKDEVQSPAMMVVDGYVLYDTPYNMWMAGDINKIPVVIGSSAQESGSMDLLPGLDKWSWTDFSDYVSEKIGTISTNLTVAAIEHYIVNESTPLEQINSMVSDIRTTCPLRHLLEAINDATEKDVYWYMVDYKPSSAVQFSNTSASTTMSTHGLDIAALFGLLHHYINPMSSSDIAFQKNIQGLFYSFASKGAPIKKEQLMGSGFINHINTKIQSRLTPYENCRIWDKYDQMYKKFAKVN